MSKNSKIVYFLITILFFIVLDIYFSNLIIDNIQNCPNNPVFDIIFVQNTGAAFSILENSKMFLIIFAIVASLGIIIFVLKNILKISTMSLLLTAMLVAGILCNMFERISLGYVRDFFKLNFINFPVFNISDVFINIGVIALLFVIIKNNYIKK